MLYICTQITTNKKTQIMKTFQTPYSSTKLTKIELENVQAMAFYNKYQSYLKQANSNKEDLMQIRSSLKSGNLDLKNRTAALQLEIIFKADAIENWNLAQAELSKYNNFEANRKYKG